VYLPTLGRFTSVDPVQGGTPNNYVYPQDPVNDFDLSGMIGWKKWFVSRYRNVASGIGKVQRFSDKHPAITNAVLMLATKGRGRGNAGEEPVRFEKFLRTGKEWTSTARDLGYSTRIPAQKAPFDSHGQPLFRGKSGYISPDVDGHSGGIWKMFDLRGNRIGTYNNDLTERIGR